MYNLNKKLINLIEIKLILYELKSMNTLIYVINIK